MSVTIFCLGKKAFDSLNVLDQKITSIIDEIVIASDKNIADDYSAKIKIWADRNHIKTIDRIDFNQSLNTSNHYIAIGWRWLLKPNNDQKLIVLHDSLLPKYRGFNPLVTALINGDEEIGVTALLGSDEFDSGDIIIQEKTKIKFPIKIKDAIDQIVSLYQTILSKILNSIINGQTLDSVPQDQHKATYSLWRDEEDYKINWNKNSQEIKRFIDAVGYPYKGAFSMIKDTKVRITDAETVQDLEITNRDVGKVIFKKGTCPVIVCGEGLLKIKEAYSEDNKRLTFENEFRLRFQ